MTMSGGIHTVSITALIVAAISWSTVLGQTAPELQNERNSLEAGRWALQFQIDNNFQLSTFEGSTFSLKKHTSDGAAWRLALSSSLNFSETENARVTDSDDDPRSESDNSTQSISVSLMRILYPAPKATVNFFWGFGPGFGFSHNSSNSKSYSTGDAMSETERTTDTWRAGVSGLLGVEWFPHRNISLLAEYESGFDYQWRKSTTERNVTGVPTPSSTKDESKSTSFGWASNGVKFGLSVYF